MDQFLLDEEKWTLVSRIFSLGGSVLLLIGSFIAVITAYYAYVRSTNNEPL